METPTLPDTAQATTDAVFDTLNEGVAATSNIINATADALADGTNKSATLAATTVNNVSNAAVNVTKTMTSEVTSMSSNVTSRLSNIISGLFNVFNFNDTLKTITAIVLIIIIATLTPYNNTVIDFGRTTTGRILLSVFLVAVVLIEGDKPMVSILLGLAIIQIFIYSEIGTYKNGESFLSHNPFVAKHSDAEHADVNESNESMPNSDALYGGANTTIVDNEEKAEPIAHNSCDSHAEYMGAFDGVSANSD